MVCLNIILNFLENMPVKEFLKSTNSTEYMDESMVSFFFAVTTFFFSSKMPQMRRFLADCTAAQYDRLLAS